MGGAIVASVEWVGVEWGERSIGLSPPGSYSTVTDFARLRGLSMSRPRANAVW